MTELTPLAWALTEKVWTFVASSVRARCETIEEETALMNREVPKLAPLIVATPVQLLANIWGVHPSEAEDWRRGIAAALAEAEKPEATKQSVYDAFKADLRWP